MEMKNLFSALQLPIALSSMLNEQWGTQAFRILNETGRTLRSFVDGSLNALNVIIEPSIRA